MSRRAQFLMFVAAGIAVSAAVLALMWWMEGERLHALFRRTDPGLTALVRSFDSAPATWLMLALSKFGSWKGIAPVTAVLAVLLVRASRWRDAVGLVTAVLGAHALQAGFKLAFQRARPSVEWALSTEQSFSFPSGHAMVAVAFWGMLTYLAWHVVGSRRWRVLLIAAAVALGLLTGASRVYLGVHYPTDVLAGFIAGGAWFACVLAGTRALHRPGDPQDHNE